MFTQIIQYGGGLIILALVYKLIFYSLIELLIIKIKFGKANILSYFPFMGPMKIYQDGEKIGGNPYHLHKMAVK